MERLYRKLSVKPLIGKIIYNIRFQIEQINHYSELDLRIKTMHIFLLSFAFYSIAVILFMLFSNGVILTLLFSVSSIFLATSVQGIMMERLRYQLLKQQIKLNDQIRHSYYEYKSVIDAVTEAAHTIDESEYYEIMIQTNKILEALNSRDLSKSTLEYSNKAPNKYLRLLMNVLYITCEYGDTILEGGASLFLRSLTTLNMEVRTELIKRERIHFLLKGLNFIIIIPLLMLQPIKNWASGSFSPLELFYQSYLGKLIEVGIIGTVFLCYYLLSKLQTNDGQYQASTKVSFLEKISYSSGVARLEQILQPKKGSIEYIEITKRLRSILSPLTVEEYYHRKSISVIITAFLFLLVHYGIILSVPGNLNSGSWLHSLVFLGAGVFIGWFLQDIFLKYQENLMKIELDEEISQLQIILLNLIHIKQINVYEILEWMELFTVHLKNPIQKCLIGFDSGSKDALDELRFSVEHIGFQHIVSNLVLATTDLSITEAFDDLENEKSFYAENRRIHNEKVIQRKQWIGQTVGFIPIYCLIIGYLTIPMILSSFSQMQVQFSQLSNIN